MTEEDRLRIILVAIATENYDSGYSADSLATCAIDPKFDLGDLGADEKLLREDISRASRQYNFSTAIQGTLDDLPDGPLNAPWVFASWMDRISVQAAPEHLCDCGPCWLFHGWSNGKGHRKVWIDGRGVYLHRYSFEQFQGVTLWGGMVLDHLCRVRNCFNPLHLESVTPLENYMRGDGPKFQFKEPEQYASDDDIAALARGW